jgi:NAD(P)-dependent dehydrogenase (short-subunit alcohol dehydrogenase family)
MLEETIRRAAAASQRTAADVRTTLAAHNPQNRFVRPEEVAAAVLWLCSDAAASITGQAISVSGGETW